MVFLSETRLDKDRATDLKHRLGFPNALVVGAEGLSGGVALFWRRDVTVRLQNMSKSHIDVVVSCDAVKVKEWRFTGFYGEPRRELRKNSWYLLRFLRAQLDLPWLCAGDFNEVLEAAEKIGGNEREQWQLEGFKAVVADCGFTDLGYMGLPYTWDNRQYDDRNIEVRLDRAFGDGAFMYSLCDTVVKHIQLAKIDHCGLLIEMPSGVVGRRRGKPFRYENMWQHHEEYNAFVQQAWDPGIGPCALSSISSTLTSLQHSMKAWDREIFGSVKKKLKELEDDLEHERSSTLYRGPTERERGLMKQLAELLAREEAMEKQRSRIQWLREGDRNTEFFQAKARARARTNRMSALKRADGSLAKSQKEMENMAMEFYSSLFAAQENLQPDVICQYVPGKVTTQMNEMLDQPFSDVEVEKALFLMGPNKAPEVDGFTA